jgi:hypothetical protein
VCDHLGREATELAGITESSLRAPGVRTGKAALLFSGLSGKKNSNRSKVQDSRFKVQGSKFKVQGLQRVQYKKVTLIKQPTASP